MTKEYIKEIPNWEKDYLDTMKDSLSKQQIELQNALTKLVEFIPKRPDSISTGFFARTSHGIWPIFVPTQGIADVPPVVPYWECSYKL